MREYPEEKGTLAMLEATMWSPRKGTGVTGRGTGGGGVAWRCADVGLGPGPWPRAAGEGHLASRWWGEVLRIISVFWVWNKWGHKMGWGTLDNIKCLRRRRWWKSTLWEGELIGMNESWAPSLGWRHLGEGGRQPEVHGLGCRCQFSPRCPSLCSWFLCPEHIMGVRPQGWGRGGRKGF